jgi:tocopherol O-methyltransferase
LTERTKFVQADYLEMPFADGSFDVVWALESVCHTDRKAAFFREAARVLRPGGRLVLLDLMRRERPFSAENEAFVQSFLHDWAIPDLDTPGEHAAHAEAVGFSKIGLTDFTDGVRVSFRNVHDMSRRWLWAGRFLHKIGLLSGVRLRNAEASVRQYEALQAGLWGYFLLAGQKGK